MGRMEREQALERFERVAELPMLVLAVAMVPLLILPLTLDLPSGVESAFVATDWLIWAAFAVEYAVRLYLAPRRLQFVRREWPDLVILALPFLRPLRLARSARALRMLRLTRLVTFLGSAARDVKRLLVRHRLHYVLLASVLIVIGAAAITLPMEGGPGTIKSFGDSLWWAVSTFTTGAYGDAFPVTPAGRGVAVLLMVAGIALIGILTANLAAFLLERGPGEPGSDEDLSAKLDEVLRRLAALEDRAA